MEKSVLSVGRKLLNYCSRSFISELMLVLLTVCCCFSDTDGQGSPAPGIYSNYGVQVGMFGYTFEYVSQKGTVGGVWGYGSATRFAQSPGGASISASVHFSDAASLEGARGTLHLYSGGCGTGTEYIDPFRSSPIGSNEGTFTNGLFSADMLVTGIYLPNPTTIDYAVVVKDEDGIPIVCAALEDGREMHGIAGSVNSSYFFIQSNGVQALPLFDYVKLYRSQLGRTTLSLRASNFRPGFPYSADVHVLPCNMGGGSLYRYGRFSESVRLSFGEIYNESAHAVEVEVNAILGAGAASVIVKDCLTTTGEEDFSGSCEGGEPQMICFNIVPQSFGGGVSSSTAGTDTTMPTTVDQHTDPCSTPNTQSTSLCENFQSLDYCSPDHRYYEFMMSECRYTCNDCDSGSGGSAVQQQTNAPGDLSTVSTRPFSTSPPIEGVKRNQSEGNNATDSPSSPSASSSGKSKTSAGIEVFECPAIFTTGAGSAGTPAISTTILEAVVIADTSTVTCCLPSSVDAVREWHLSSGLLTLAKDSKTYAAAVAAAVVVGATLLLATVICKRSRQSVFDIDDKDAASEYVVPTRYGLQDEGTHTLPKIAHEKTSFPVGSHIEIFLRLKST